MHKRPLATSEAVRGEGGVLRNSKGDDFTARASAWVARATRCRGRAIDAEMALGRAMCLSRHHAPPRIPAGASHIYDVFRNGIDMAKEPVLVSRGALPMRRNQTNVDARTPAGLYAIGEVACTGLRAIDWRQPAPRRAGYCHRAAGGAQPARPPAHPAGSVSLPEWKSGDVQNVDELVVIYHNWDEIRRLMWDYVGIVRTDKRLQRASARLRNLQREIQEFYWNFRITVDLLELRNLATVAALIVDSALSRKESRGLHFTMDYPEIGNEVFRRDTLLSRG